MTRHTYRALPRATLAEQNGHALFQAVYEHVIDQIPDAWTFADTERLEGVPVPVTNAWTLWWFAAEVGGNGLPDYFLNHCQSVEQARAYLEALEAVGACELAAMFRDSASLAVAAESELTSLPGAEWFEGLGFSGRWADLEAMEAPSMALAADPLSQRVAEYLRAAHRAGEIRGPDTWLTRGPVERSVERRPRGGYDDVALGARMNPGHAFQTHNSSVPFSQL